MISKIGRWRKIKIIKAESTIPENSSDGFILCPTRGEAENKLNMNFGYVGKK
jgi:hypothetical protein